MTNLHARIDVLEGELSASLAGAAFGLSKRAFAVLTLMRADGATGLGEAAPLPGYSSDSIEQACDELHQLINGPVCADPLGRPFEVLSDVFTAHSVQHPSSRFALETALLDWLGHTRGEPVHQVIGGEVERRPIPIADLVFEPDASAWPARIDALLGEGATHVKLKIGADFDREVTALSEIRRAHPTLRIRLDGNGRVPLDALRRHAALLEAMDLDFIEEPVPRGEWLDALSLPLPFALDETVRSQPLSQRLLETGRIHAVVLKPMVLGGFRASFDAAERASDCGATCLVSHTFDGPIARAATAELALALQTRLAAGLGVHPGLDLWAPHHISAIRGREIIPHDSPGLGFRFEEGSDG